MTPPSSPILETDSPQKLDAESEFAGREAAPLFVFSVEGMTCASCASRVEGKLRAVSGVTSANVNFASKKAFIRGGPNLKGTEPLLEAVEKAGYGLKPLLAKQKYADLYRVERMRLAWRVVVGGLLVLPFLLEHLLMGFLPFHLSAW